MYKFFDLLNEEKQHDDNEIVDFNEISLQNEFNKLNSLLFQNKIKPVRMVFHTRKRAHGHVKAYINKQTKEIIIKELGMSKFLDIPYKFFKDVLAHEMIHVLLFQKGLNVNHGPEFVDEMNRINSMGLGFNVTIKGDSSNFKMSKNIVKSSVELVFCLFDFDMGLKNIMVMNHKTYKSEGKKITIIFNDVIKNEKANKINGAFYKSNLTSLQKYTIQRSFDKQIKFRRVNDEYIKELLDNSKLLSNFECTKSGCNWTGNDIPNEPLQKKQSRDDNWWANF